VSLSVVTGTFSFTGRFIAERLLAKGEAVRTLSRRPAPGHPLAAHVSYAELQFAARDRLHEALRGGRAPAAGRLAGGARAGPRAPLRLRARAQLGARLSWSRWGPMRCARRC
jgi:nucleoside-diphosphate-sugar epimerase